jgi:hypothetical protein
MTKKEKVSPLKDMPLRQPGESLDDQILDGALDGLLSYYLMATGMMVLTVFEWIGYLTEAPRQPFLFTIISIPFAGYCVYRAWRNSKHLANLRLARRGERSVGQFLELFREDGAKVFHDLIGENFNVDHLLISTQGVFVIETKTYSKPHDGRVIYDGKKILIDGYNKESKLLTQARAEASWVRKLIKDSAGKTVDVEPIIVFPGWYVESTKQGNSSDVQVMNPRLLRGYINQRPQLLSKEDVALFAYHISRFSRAIE